MKKRCIVLSILLAFSMLLGACGSGDPFEGKWRGTLDVTKQFEDGIVAKYPELADYVDFEELVFVVDVTFDDGVMSMAVDQSSVDSFYTNFADGMLKVEEGSLMEYLNAVELTLEEAVAESGMTEEEYLEDVLTNALPVEQITTSMTEVTDAALAGFEAVNGTYTFNEETLNVRYEETEYEAIEYSFEGDDLILIFTGDGFSLRVECEKVTE